MPILSMKLFDHFGNHILDLNKAHYITYNILIKLNQRRSRYFIIPKIATKLRIHINKVWLLICNYASLSLINVILSFLGS